MTLLQRRLPGVRVEVPTPALREALPRMDIALFVGFTASGPIDLPVAVESLGEFEAVFGEEIVLARAAQPAEEDHRGLLHPCVRGFFSAGGRRCWIVRVAGAAAQTTLFPLGNMLVARAPRGGSSWHLEPALIASRSPGSWADGLAVATRLIAQPLLVRRVDSDDDSRISLEVLGAPALALRSGDLLRFTLAGDTLVHMAIAEVDPPASDSAGRLARCVRSAAVCALHGHTAGSPSAAISHLAYFEAARDNGELVEVRVEAHEQWTEQGVSVGCRLPARRVPSPGAVLKVGFADGAEAWFGIAASVVTQTGDADGEVGVELSGRLWHAVAGGGRAALEHWLSGHQERSAVWLRLGLRVSGGQDADFTLDGIAMAAALDARSSGLGITTLPDDQQFFGPQGDGAAATPVSHAFELTRRDSLGRLTRRFPLASLPGASELMLIPLGNEQEFGTGLSAIGIDLPPLQRDGLDAFSWQLFAEPSLADIAADALAEQAEAVRFFGSTLRTLRGMHAAFGSENAGVADEPTLLAIPDAVHPGWRMADPQPAWIELPPPIHSPAPACDCAFRDCALTLLPAPSFVPGRDPDPEGSFLLQWTEPEPRLHYELQEASGAAFAAAAPLYSGTAARFAVLGKRPGSQFYRVRASAGLRLSAWSAAIEVRVGLTGYNAKPWTSDDLLAIHRLMLRTAAGRGDMLAILGLPRHYRFDDAVAHAHALRNPGTPAGVAISPPAIIPPRPIGEDEGRALSHGALYHPWLLTRRVDTVVASPPDGAVCGQLAAGALDRGAWVAVANQPLRDVVALSAAASRDDRQRLLDAQVNLVRSCPHGFVLSTADTLTPEADWRSINVRRLMTLLRRLALRRGACYVFEPNGATLRRTVERSFEAVMDELFRRGAFAGATSQSAYRVDVGDDINTLQRTDLGQFRVDLKVAPSLPLTFLTVRLARSGERLVARETH